MINKNTTSVLLSVRRKAIAQRITDLTSKAPGSPCQLSQLTASPTASKGDKNTRRGFELTSHQAANIPQTSWGASPAPGRE